MRTDAEHVTLDYIDAVHRRMHDLLEPTGFTPDWTDRPLPHTYHPGAERIALPLPAELAPPMTDRPGEGALELETLAADLQAAVGVIARRYQIDWNADLDDRTAPHTARWGRGTPSGGGTYPLEVYWAAGPSAPLPAGVFHYASGLHAMERLSGEDPTAAVRAALGPQTASLGDQFLLCTVRLWKNSFKYHNLAYHLATLDLGAFTGSWELLCRDRNMPYRQRLWFDENALNGLLGLNPDEESVHAVIPLRWQSGGRRTEPADQLTVRQSHYERSRTVRDFPLAQAVRRATAEAPATAPASVPAEDAGLRNAADRVPLPRVAPDPLAGRAVATLARRSSASGRLDGARPLELERLAEVIRAAVSADTGTSETGEPPRLTGLSLVARRVTGLDPGLYGHLRDSRTLTRVPGDGLSAVTQGLYGMDNYSVSHAPALLVLHWHPEQAISAHGPRAYRAANIEAGAAVQRAHLAATALGLAAGIVFGIDAVTLDDALGLTEQGRRSQVYLFLGHPQPGAAALDGRLR